MLHFVGFTGNEFVRACQVFGKPDFVHRFYDARCKAEIAPTDIVIFANGEELKQRTFAYDDSAFF